MDADQSASLKAVMLTDKQIRWVRGIFDAQAADGREKPVVLAALDGAFAVSVEFNPDYAEGFSTKRDIECAGRKS